MNELRKPTTIADQRRLTGDVVGNTFSDNPSVCAVLKSQEALINELAQQLGKLHEQLSPILLDVPTLADAPPSPKPPMSQVTEAIIDNTARLNDIIEGVKEMQRAVNL